MKEKGFTSTDDELLRSLAKYDVVIPRHPLKKLLSASSREPWKVFAFKPRQDGPLFIERSDRYRVEEGNVGALFEKQMTNRADCKFNRTYSVSCASLGNFQLALTGEVDCLDSAGVLVEIKSKPAWVKPDPARELSTWMQSKLIGVETIVTGGFTTTRGRRDGPVTFSKANIQYESLARFGSRVDAGAKNHAMQVMHDVISKLVQTCKRVGVLYVVTLDNNNDPGAAVIRESEPAEFPFPITSDVLQNCSLACKQYVAEHP